MSKTSALMVLAIADVISNKDNPRIINEKTADFKVLVDSIRESGVQVRPIVRPHPDKAGKYQLLAGERRTRAAKIAGLTTIPVEVRQGISEAEAFETTFAENFAREDLTPLEQSRAVATLLTRFDGARDLVAKKLNLPEREIRRRAQLQKLTPKWKKAIQDPGHKVSSLTIGHLGLIAPLPEKMQDEILRKAGNYDDLLGGFEKLRTVPELSKAIRLYLHDLSGASWDLDDPALVTGCKACNACMSRSDAENQVDLWDPPAKAAKAGALCLDKKCWEKKADAYIKASYDALKKEHPKLSCIAANMDYTEEKAAAKKFGPLEKSWTIQACKKTDPKARPVLALDGGGAGSIRWVKDKHGYGGSTRQKAKAKTLKERRKSLDIKRWEKPLSDLAHTIEGMLLPRSLSSKLIPLAAAFGAPQKNDNVPGSPSAMKAYAAIRGGGKPAATALWALLQGSLSKHVCGNLWGLEYHLTARVSNARAVAVLLEIDLTGMHKKTCALPKYTEPKSWANLKANGTPKKPAAKPAKKKTAKPTKKKAVKKNIKKASKSKAKRKNTSK